MGVTGLWPILAPSARPTPLPTLNRKRLAVDASIWIYQFLKAVRDKEGNALPNSHIVGFFRRICKLLYFGIKPVFVFDGGAPVLKRQTIQSRKQRREGRREDAVRTAGKLLAVQMKQRVEEKEEKRKRNRERQKRGLTSGEEEPEIIATDKELVYVDEMGMSIQERHEKRKFHKTDAYHLPDLPNSIEGMGQPNDPRIMSTEELEEYAKQFNNGEDINLYDFSKIDFDGEFFMSLPARDRYNILNAARLRSRLRMGLSKEQLEKMFPDRMEFSRFQIERVRERNELTQRLMNLNGMNDDLIGVGTGRIAGDSSREYVLVRNEGVEGGWALGVVSADKKMEGERNKPIDVDSLGQPKDENLESEDEDDFEDVPVEGLNRLPKFKESDDVNNNLQFTSIEENIRMPNFSLPSETTDSLFIEDNTAKFILNQEETDEDELNQAIALSLQQIDDYSDADKHVKQAIELSLQNNNIQESINDVVEISEYIHIPNLNQKVVQAHKPINATDGNVIDHIFNNRANAATLKQKARDISTDSDDELDLLSTLAKAKKLESSKKTTGPVSLVPGNSSHGPLPFEKLESIFQISQVKRSQVNEDDTETEDSEGGFEKEVENDKAPRPIPPWLQVQGDIRSDVEMQRKRDAELNGEDKLRAEEDQQRLLRDMGPILIESSDDDDDVKILDTIQFPGTTAKINTNNSISSQNPLISTEVTLEPDPKDIEEDTVDSDKIDWSESDCEDANIASRDNLSENTKSASPEFEDIEIEADLNTEIVPVTTPMGSGQIFSEANDILSSVSPSVSANFKSSDGKYDAEMRFIEVGNEDFSDPDDEELLAQLAIEAQEHGRFASTLNHKSELENQQDYERELKALRAQQKKDRRDADEVSQTMITECQALLRFFGIPYITAPMEAEAQCAELVRLSLVDGIVTDDCDIFLFGGTRVYKNMFNSNKYVECYLATDIEKELSLSREHLISIAHLLGSDYTEGLPGIGPVTALEIISEFPSVSDFASWWRTAQYSTDTETSNFRRKFRRTQATKLFLPSGFPSQAVSEAYWDPEVDKSKEEFQWGVPDLEQLRNFLMATIGWSRERTDEVLVPVIRDMNRRETDGTQSNITQFFEGGLGAGVRGQVSANNVGTGSKRMRAAVGKLKAKKQSHDGVLNKTFADEAREWVQREQSRKDKENEDQVVRKSTGKGKRKGIQKNSKKTNFNNDDTYDDYNEYDQDQHDAITRSDVTIDKGTNQKTRIKRKKTVST
ncbi:putative dna excision repair protein [Erysiphe neolycopersici]|uniref:Putative dna excision repair protein n=1 Tax=Erysiphe neolycopersici TaxID=212602 RepID=A0A420HW53_9PEZI|nr:putative dna excision repair protein [Erysiphe neolycopersici]